MKRSHVAVLAAALGVAAFSWAQVPAPPHGCDSPQSKQLDFWLGDWELSYASGGRSHSAYDRAAKQWKQTWVDNTAAWLDFTGGMVDGKMQFAREAEKDGKRFRQRMLFEDVKADSLKWLWQRSDDGGKTWTSTWEVDYRRVK